MTEKVPFVNEPQVEFMKEFLKKITEWTIGRYFNGVNEWIPGRICGRMLERISEGVPGGLSEGILGKFFQKSKEFPTNLWIKMNVCKNFVKAFHSLWKYLKDPQKDVLDESLQTLSIMYEFLEKFL